MQKTYGAMIKTIWLKAYTRPKYVHWQLTLLLALSRFAPWQKVIFPRTIAAIKKSHKYRHYSLWRPTQAAFILQALVLNSGFFFCSQIQFSPGDCRALLAYAVFKMWPASELYPTRIWLHCKYTTCMRNNFRLDGSLPSEEEGPGGAAMIYK